MADDVAGWQSDPTGRHEHRYWDGTQWTDHVSDAGVATTDAYASSPTADAPDMTADDSPAEATPGWADPTTTLPSVGADPTASWTTPPAVGSDPTASWTTPPAPPVPPAFTPTPGDGDGGDGSKKRLLVGGGILAAVVLAVVAFLLLGGDDKGSDSVRTQLAAQIRANSELSEEQADCVADHIVDDMGADRFKDVDFTAEDPPEDIADDMFKSAFASLSDCKVDPSAFGSTSDTTEKTSDGEGTYGSDPELDALYDQCKDGDYEACDELYNQSPSGSEYETFADTCGERNEPQGYCVDVYGDSGSSGGGGLGTDGVPAGFEDQLADVYEQSLGLPRDKAECLAGKIAEAVGSGDLSQDDAMSDVFSYLSDCDIDISEINGGDSSG